MCGAVWLTMEQVATAALDCRALPLASSIVAQICDKFPGSLRAARMMVRCCEHWPDVHVVVCSDMAC